MTDVPDNPAIKVNMSYDITFNWETMDLDILKGVVYHATRAYEERLANGDDWNV